MSTRYFAHQSCEPDDELTADEAARRPHHVRRLDAGAGAIVERIRDGAIHEVIYDGVEPTEHAARYGAVPYQVMRTIATTTGRVIERDHHRADGTPSGRTCTQLDLAGRPQVEEHFDAAGAPTSRDVYTWDGDELRQVVTHQPDGRSEVTYQADEDEDEDEDAAPAPAPPAATPARRTITFEQGHPAAPDAPWGQQILTLTTDGTLGYQQRVKGEVRSLSGRVDPARIGALLAALARTSFPAPPQQSFLPGASVTTLVVEPGGRVVIDYFVALKLDGYREVVRALGDLNTALRKRDDAALATWRFEPIA